MNIQNILPRRSRRLATITPASHWISICLYSEDIARGMETLQHTMNKYYEEGDNGDNMNVVRLLPNVAFDEVDDDFDFDVMFDDLSDKMLPNHEMMLPHWKKFAKWCRVAQVIHHTSTPTPHFPMRCINDFVGIHTM